MNIIVQRFIDAPDGSAKGEEWRFSASSQMGEGGFVIRCTFYALLERQSKRHKYRYASKWDWMDERSYHSDIQRDFVPLPSDVIAEAVSKFPVTFRIGRSDLAISGGMVWLTEWERSNLKSYASATFLTYASHKLFPAEEMVKHDWLVLSDKLAGVHRAKSGD